MREQKWKWIPGRHSFEFKYPKIGFGGRVYNATFTTEPGKTYEISRSDTNDAYPMVIDEASQMKLTDAVIRQVSVQKAEAKVTKIPGIEDGKYATVVSDCCDGFKLSANAKGTPLGNIIGLYKIDSYWGPNPMGFQVSFNSSMNGTFKILIPPGEHSFTMAIAASPGLFKTNKVSSGWLSRILDTDDFPDEVFSISAVLEAGKTYGFDYQLTYKNLKPPYETFHQVNLVEVPEGWKKEK